MKVLIFGGSGKIGSAVAWDLAQDDQIKTIGITGRNQEKLEKTKAWIGSDKIVPHILDVDDRKTAAELMRQSIVAAAQRSPSGQRKATTKRTHDDLPVHSLQTLLDDLATIAKNRVQSTHVQGAEFYLITRPTPPQRRALELLDVSL